MDNLAFFAAILPLYADMQRLRDPGYQKVWIVQGMVSRVETDWPLPSLGRQWL